MTTLSIEEMSRLVDALCRTRIGWSGSVEGDNEDFTEADKMVCDRGKAASGSFREPTEVERLREKVEILEAEIRVMRNLPAAIDAALPAGQSDAPTEKQS